MLVLCTVVAVTFVPTIWDAVYTDAFGSTCGGCSPTFTNCTCANGTTGTLLKLVPVLFVALMLIVGVLLATGYKVPGT